MFNIGKGFFCPVFYRRHRFTVQRNLMNVSNVGKHSGVPVSAKHMKELIRERNRTYASTVAKPSLMPALAQYEITSERNSWLNWKTWKTHTKVNPISYVRENL